MISFAAQLDHRGRIHFKLLTGHGRGEIAKDGRRGEDEKHHQ